MRDSVVWVTIYMANQFVIDSEQEKESSVLIESEAYIDDLWFLLHHSEDEDTLVLGLTCYLDDSATTVRRLLPAEGH
jgi:hypothetical protein